MPLKSGTSNKVVSENIREMLADVKHGDGRIGNVRPRNRSHAQKVAIAVALRKKAASKVGLA